MSTCDCTVDIPTAAHISSASVTESSCSTSRSSQPYWYSAPQKEARPSCSSQARRSPTCSGVWGLRGGGGLSEPLLLLLRMLRVGLLPISLPSGLPNGLPRGLPLTELPRLRGDATGVCGLRGGGLGMSRGLAGVCGLSGGGVGSVGELSLCLQGECGLGGGGLGVSSGLDSGLIGAGALHL